MKQKTDTSPFVKTKEDTLRELYWHQRHLKAAYDSRMIPQADYIKDMALINRLIQEAEQ